jgi:putative SOS response-associated peptidase YedK
MPVILHPNDYALWLEENPDSNDFVKLLEPIASSQMEETVSSLSEGPLELDLG